MRGVALLHGDHRQGLQQAQPEARAWTACWPPCTTRGRCTPARSSPGWSKGFGDKVFHTVISRTVRFPDATVAGEPITSFDPASTRSEFLPGARQGGAGAVAAGGARGSRSRRVSLPGVAELLRPAGARPRSRRRAPGQRPGAAHPEDHGLPVRRELLDLERPGWPCAVTASPWTGQDRPGGARRAAGRPRCRGRAQRGRQAASQGCLSAAGAGGRRHRVASVIRAGQPGPALTEAMTSTMTAGERAAHGPGRESAGPASRFTSTSSRAPSTCCSALISKHKLDITEVALSQVTDEFIALHPGPGRLAGTWTRPATSWWSRRPCSTSRRPGCCPRARSRTRRTSPCWRPGTCCSPGCCSTAPTRRSRRCCAGRMAAARAAGSRAGSRWSRGSPSCCPRCCSASGPAEFAAIAAPTLAPRRPPVVSTEHLHAPRTSVREQAEIIAGRLRAAAPGHVPPADRRLRGHLRGGGAVPRAARALPGRSRLLRPG